MKKEKKDLLTRIGLAATGIGLFLVVAAIEGEPRFQYPSHIYNYDDRTASPPYKETKLKNKIAEQNTIIYIPKEDGTGYRKIDMSTIPLESLKVSYDKRSNS